MTIASKLTESVRQAKEAAAKQHEETGSDTPDLPSDPPSPQEDKAATNPARETERPRAGKRPGPEPPDVPFPSRPRVWPD